MLVGTNLYDQAGETQRSPRSRRNDTSAPRHMNCEECHSNRPKKSLIMNSRRGMTWKEAFLDFEFYPWQTYPAKVDG